MPAMMVTGAMPLGDLVDSACVQGAVYSEAPPFNKGTGEALAYLDRNGIRATLYTNDRSVIVGPETVEYVENVLAIQIAS